MSKGSSGSAPPPAPTSSTVTQTNLPAYAEPFFTRLMERTEEESASDYIPYTGQRLTEFGADTQAGFQGLRDIAGSGRGSLFTGAQGAFDTTAGYNPTQQDQFADLSSYTDPGVAQQYMDPYIQNVLDVQQRRLQERYGEQQGARNAAAIGAGAFGNNRRGVEDFLAQRELNREQQDIEARGLSQAYQTGAGIFGTERSAELQQRGMNAQLFDANRQAMLEQGRNRIAAGQAMGTQAQSEEAIAQARARGLVGLGGAIEDRTQQGLDLAHTDFLNQRDFPRNQLNFYSGILRGVPISANQEVTRYDAPPNQMSQLLGAGLGTAAIANALG